jgi:hypothetical protein
MNRKEALIGLAVYKGGRILLKQLNGKGGLSMASKKKIGILAGIGAAVGALMFWRKKKKQQEFFQS